MKKVFIKYNPYTITTEITIDGKALKPNSQLNIENGIRLQEWIDDMPRRLKEECNTQNLEIIFHGNQCDYEDLAETLKDHSYQLEHIPAKEAMHKEEDIKNLFSEIQNGPFKELNEKDLKDAFDKVLGNEFPVNVVATMSAGKSTLINALLREKLMPSSNEACTATITEIHDTDAECFSAETFNQVEQEIENTSELTLKKMKTYNDNPEVATIKAYGNIPFVTAEDTALVLMDTPGPNNSRNKDHQLVTEKALSENAKNLVLYVLDGSSLSSTDDDRLLNKVAESMQIGGKQSRDRFIFVINKLDDFKKDEDNIQETLKGIKERLEEKGIRNPNIYPLSALLALNIRTLLKDINIINYDDDDEDADDDIIDARADVKKFTRKKNTAFYFEQYAPLPTSIKDNIDAKVKELESSRGKNNQDSHSRSEALKEIALIHSGIISLEHAIKNYVDKYAKPQKIKTLVDTFQKKIESQNMFELLKQNIAKNDENHAAITEQIEAIQNNINKGEDARQFERKIDSLDFSSEIKNDLSAISKSYGAKTRTKMEEGNREMHPQEAIGYCNNLNKFAQELMTDLQITLENKINKQITDSADKIYDEYVQRIRSFTDQLNTDQLNIEVIEIDPFSIIEGYIPKPKEINQKIHEHTQKKTVEDGIKYVKNTDKQWFKPWTWFQEDGYNVTKYKDIKVVNTKDLLSEFISPLRKQVEKNIAAAEKHTNKMTEKVKQIYKPKFKEIDQLLNARLSELQKFTSDEARLEEELKTLNNNIEWLKSIKSKMNAILDI